MLFQEGSAKAQRAQFITGSFPAPETGAGAEELGELFKELSKVWKVVEAAQSPWDDPSPCLQLLEGRFLSKKSQIWSPELQELPELKHPGGLGSAGVTVGLSGQAGLPQIS